MIIDNISILGESEQSRRDVEGGEGEGEGYG